MLIGQLGRADGQDLICVQSLDGQLRIFGHTGEILTCSLPGFLLPGPLAYVSRTNIILTANTDRSLEAYRYQVLTSGAQQTTIKKAKVYLIFTEYILSSLNIKYIVYFV